MKKTSTVTPAGAPPPGVNNNTASGGNAGPPGAAANANSKDRPSKSAQKKRPPSNGPGAPSAAGAHFGTNPLSVNIANNTLSEDASVTDTPITIWPEWSDAEVLAEKWPTKHVFEDPDGPPVLPRSLRGLFDGTRRPAEFAAGVDPATFTAGAVTGVPTVSGPIGCATQMLLEDVFYTQAPVTATAASVATAAAAVAGFGGGGLPRSSSIGDKMGDVIVGDAIGVVTTTANSGGEAGPIAGDAASMHSATTDTFSPANPVATAAGATTAAFVVPAATPGDDVNPARTSVVTASTSQPHSGLDGQNSVQGTPLDVTGTAVSSLPPPLTPSTAPIPEDLASANNQTPGSGFPTADDSNGTRAHTSGSGTQPPHPQSAGSNSSNHHPHHHGFEEDPQQAEQEAFAGTSKFFQANKHLLHSELIRNIVATFHLLYEQSRLFKGSGYPDEFAPWDGLYPKGKDGLPMYNASGKYMVKVFWLGSWRKITLDDKIPVDDQGKPLVVSSSIIQELWPMLISKALLKVASTSFREIDISVATAASATSESPKTVNPSGGGGMIGTFPGTAIGSLTNMTAPGVPGTLSSSSSSSSSTPPAPPEQGDFDALHALKGWIPERIRVLGLSQNGMTNLWTALTNLNMKSPHAGGAAPKGSIFVPNGGGGSGAGGGLGVGGGGGGGAGGFPGKMGGSSISDRSQLASAAGGRAGTAHRAASYVLVLAYRDGEDLSEKFDLASLPYFYRVCDVKEAVTLKEGDVVATQRLIKIKGYFTCGVKSKKTGDKVGSVKDDGDSDAAETWILFSDFCKMFKFINVYHNQGSFKYLRNIQCINDPAKPMDVMKIPPVLYVQEPLKETSIIMCLNTYGRTKADSIPHITSVSVEEYDWKSIPVSSVSQGKNPLLRLTSNGSLATFVKLPATRGAYKVLVDCPTSYHLSFWAKEEFMLEDESKYLSECLGLNVRDIEESFPAQPQNSWFILFKTMFKITEPVFMAANLFLPESLQLASSVKVFDNDSGQEIPHVFFNLPPRRYLPNKNGYTIAGDCRTVIARASSKWRLRVVSEPTAIFPIERPLEISVKPNIQDFEDIYIPNKHNLLLRYVLKLKDTMENNVAAQLSFAIPTVMVKLQIFDGTQEIASAKGNGLATIHSTLLLQGTSDKEVKDPATPGLPVLPKNRYYLQATVDSVELGKVLGSSAIQTGPNQGIGLVGGVSMGGAGAKSDSADPSRPGSRGATKSSASARKKKSIMLPTPTIAGASPGVSPATGNIPGDGAASATSPYFGTAILEPAWKLRVVSMEQSPIVVAKDTEKEDRYKMIKDSWEAKEPGRAARAKEIREAYLRNVESGLIRLAAFHVPVTKAEGIDAAPAGAGTSNRRYNSGLKPNDMVYKPWTIVKENGSGGRPIMEIAGGLERVGNIAVFSPDGEVLPVSTGASAPGPAPLMAIAASEKGSMVSGLNIMQQAENMLALKSDPRRLSMFPSAMESSLGSLKRTSTVTQAVEFSSDDRLDSLSGDATGLIPRQEIAIQETWPPKLYGRVMTAEERAERNLERQKFVDEQEAVLDAIRKERSKNREFRNLIKVVQHERLEEHQKEVEVEREEDAQRREAYRQRVIKEFEEANARRTALEAQRLAELAALEQSAEEQAAAAAAAAASEKGKKKGKK